MKKNIWLLAIYAVALAASAVVLWFARPEEPGPNFWIGVVFYVIGLTAVLASSMYYRSSTRADAAAGMSPITASMIYLAASAAISLVLGALAGVSTGVFISAHVAAFAAYVIATIIVFKGLSHIEDVGRAQQTRHVQKQLLYVRASEIYSDAQGLISGDASLAQFSRMVERIKSMHPNPPEALFSKHDEIESALDAIEKKLKQRDTEVIDGDIEHVMRLVDRFNQAAKAIR